MSRGVCTTCLRTTYNDASECGKCRKIRTNYGRTPESDRVAADGHYRRNYGLSLDRYDEMFAQQGGLCAVCRRPETTLNRSGVVKRLAVDHCHESGAVRSLLCDKCNRALGLLCDSPELLEAAADYVRGFAS